MRVEIDLAASPPAVTLAEPGDCGRFHVEARGEGGSGALDGALRTTDTGYLTDGGDAAVRVDAVRRLAAGSVGDGWDGEFAAMLDYARSRGWLNADGGEIQAHVEWH